MTTPNMSCPSGGQFYACVEGSRFVGCCGRDPCTVGCAAGDLVPTSFDGSQHGDIPDQQCDAGLFYTCAFTDPPFWGCCNTSPCTDGCVDDGLSAAFLSSNSGLAEPFLRLNDTYDENDDTTSGSAIAGGVVGGIAGLALIILGLLWFNRRRKRATGEAVDESQTEIQELPSTGAKQMPQSYENSPNIPSELSSPSQPQWSPKAPNYWGGPHPRHISHELPGSGIQNEMDSNQNPASNEVKHTPDGYI